MHYSRLMLWKYPFLAFRVQTCHFISVSVPPSSTFPSTIIPLQSQNRWDKIDISVHVINGLAVESLAYILMLLVVMYTYTVCIILSSFHQFDNASILPTHNASLRRASTINTDIYIQETEKRAIISFSFVRLSQAYNLLFTTYNDFKLED